MTAFLWAIVTACIWGVVPIFEKAGLVKTEPFTALFFRCLGVLAGLLILALFAVKPAEIKAVDTKSMVLLIASGFLASFVAQITFYHGLKMGDVSLVVPVSGCYPLIAFFLSLFILGEALTTGKLVGVVMIICGVWLLR